MEPATKSGSNATDWLGLVDEYNAGLCEAALQYNHEAIADFVHDAETGFFRSYNTSVADEGPVTVNGDYLNWSDALVNCGVSPEYLKADLDLLLAGKVIRYKKRKEWEIDYGKRLKASGLQYYYDYEEITGRIKAIKQLKYDMSVLGSTTPKITEVNRGDFEQWRLKTDWQALPQTGVALVDWAIEFEFLRARQDELFALVKTVTDPKIREDITKAALIAVDLQTALGSPPAAPVKTPAEIPGKSVSDSPDEVSMGPAFVHERGTKKVYTGQIETPEIKIGFGTKNAGAHSFEVAFWGGLAGRLHAEFVTTFIDNQTRFNNHILRQPRYKPFAARETFTRALGQTVTDMSHTATAGSIEIDKRLKGSDFDTDCPRVKDVDPFVSYQYPSYVAMERDYQYLCSAYEFTKELYTKESEGVLKFNASALSGAESFGTSYDPRMSYFSALDKSEDDILPLNEETLKKLTR